MAEYRRRPIRATGQPRLDVPRGATRRRVLPRFDAEAFGTLSERFARFLGTARFLGYMTAFVLIWIGWNVAAPVHLRWDRYPFIFLTLILSLQASYAAPLILLAQNRQADRDRIAMDEDRTQNTRARADMDYLAREIAAIRIALGDVATRDFLRSEVSKLADAQRSDEKDELPR
jgi:uncharacterized membrane protein